MSTFEIHCPDCGTLYRQKTEAKPSRGCPDCGNPQAIFIPDEAIFINHTIQVIELWEHRRAMNRERLIRRRYEGNYPIKFDF
jgi:predicted  nucleic acid-binding Zn-ribbon protein